MKNDIELAVNTSYKQYKNNFVLAYQTKAEVTSLLKRCGLPTKEANIFFLNFGQSIAVAVDRGFGFYIEDYKVFA